MSLVNTLKEIAGSFSSYKSRCEAKDTEILNLRAEIDSLKQAIDSLEQDYLALRKELEEAEGLADEILGIIKQA